jgi:hypothetical protein
MQLLLNSVLLGVGGLVTVCAKVFYLRGTAFFCVIFRIFV